MAIITLCLTPLAITSCHLGTMYMLLLSQNIFKKGRPIFSYHFSYEEKLLKIDKKVSKPNKIFIEHRILANIGDKNKLLASNFLAERTSPSH